MKTFSNVMMLAVGACAGIGAYMGYESLNKNKYQVKKRINDTIDHVTNNMK